jgi:uncharacterized protein YdeI (YjbR/CyaY-like superfamily)
MDNNLVEKYFASQALWQEPLLLLREIILSTGLEETVKWGSPVYMYNKKNVLGIFAFKSYFGIWFFQGALLEDKNKVLINAQEGKTAALRQCRFVSSDEIDEALIIAYINEAIQNVKEGREIKPDRKKPLVIPGQLLKFL